MRDGDPRRASADVVADLGGSVGPLDQGRAAAVVPWPGLVRRGGVRPRRAAGGHLASPDDQPRRPSSRLTEPVTPTPPPAPSRPSRSAATRRRRQSLRCCGGCWRCTGHLPVERLLWLCHRRPPREVARYSCRDPRRVDPATGAQHGAAGTRASVHQRPDHRAVRPPGRPQRQRRRDDRARHHLHGGGVQFADRVGVPGSGRHPPRPVRRGGAAGRVSPG
jgi:hypothetical protein